MQPTTDIDPALTTALSAETKAAFFQCLGDAQRALSAHYSNVPLHVQKQVGIKIDDRLQMFWDLLQNLAVDNSSTYPSIPIPETDDCWSPFLKFFTRPEVQPIHFVRLMLLVERIRKTACGDDPYVLGHNFDSLVNHYHETHSYGLREIARAFKAVGLDQTVIARHHLNAWEFNVAAWPADSIWPYWSEHLDLLDQALPPTIDPYRSHVRRNALNILATFPAPPERFVERLWTFGFGAKSERAEAQVALRRQPNLLNKVSEEIVSADAERRTIAAEWLGRIGDPAAIGPLMRVVKTEKNIEPRNAMLLALESLGGPLDTLLNRESLLNQSKETLAEDIPQELQWFPHSALPSVHWSDTGEVVPLEILQGWLIETFRLKNPEPGPLLRRYCSQLRPGEREALGRFVLQNWIAQETYTRKGPLALTCKGILAIAAACCGADAASAARTYLTNWPRERAGQCKALVQMLAWIDHPAATQILFAVSSRFKPATIQEESRRLSLALAQRKQWTVEQMADRAIPTAGLNENGEMRLSYGARVFVARLNNQLDFVLTDGDCKQIKSLPLPRMSDDKVIAQEARRTFSSAKKELKSVLQIQRDRLYEAMCIQRTWNIEEWETYLNQHAVMRLLCQKLVWFATGENESMVLFRPLGDGTLTDVGDNPVRLPRESRIGLAHESKLSIEISRQWQQHLADYGIEPLFPQFGIHEFKPSATQLEATAFNDFEGHAIDAFTLRGKAGKLGYSRGATVDGPWFNEYLKNFPTLGITAVIEFTGNSMPEENRQVALTGLYFKRQKEKSLFDAQVKIPLREVPSVLLSECWNHMRHIAAEGPGFDPEWKAKIVI